MSVLCVAPLYSTLVPRNLLSPDSFHSNYRLLHSFPTRRSSDLSVQRWARANAARTFRANKVAPSVDENTRLKDMDEFVAPLPIDIVLQLLDALLDHAEAVRQRKGYDAIVYIDRKSTRLNSSHVAISY